jgi:pyridoxine kinase
VEFSNHTGYSAWRGKILGAELVSDLVTGLEERGVLKYCQAILSGYLGDAAVGAAVIQAVQKVKAASPSAIYCCDPVMGDLKQGFFVKPDIPAIFKNEMIPQADIITPNHFELEALTGLAGDTITGALQAIRLLHDRGPKVVLVTSFLEKGAEKNQIGMLASDKTGVYQINTPRLPLGDGLSGSGDLTAAVFLSRYLESGDVKRTLEQTASSVYGIMEITAQGLAADPKRPRELFLIQAQNELAAPSSQFEALRL